MLFRERWFRGQLMYFWFMVSGVLAVRSLSAGYLGTPSKLASFRSFLWGLFVRAPPAYARLFSFCAFGVMGSLGSQTSDPLDILLSVRHQVCGPSWMLVLE